MNILSYPSALIQGRPGKIGRVQGNFSPFKIGRPIVLLDAAKGLTLNGSGADLIDEDFATDPSWTDLGSGSSIIGGESVATLDGAASITGIYQTFASQTACWAEFDITFGVGFTSDIGERFFGSGITDSVPSSGGVNPVIIGLNNIAGVLNVEILYRTDAGFLNFVFPAVLGFKYHFTIEWAAASAPAANDGIARVWNDTVLILEDTAVDSDTVTAEAAFAGGYAFTSGNFGTIAVDNFKVGTTGASPAQVSQENDQSGFGNDASQSTAVDQPSIIIVDSNFNNNPSISYDGVSEFLQAPDSPSLSNLNSLIFFIAINRISVNENILSKSDNGEFRIFVGADSKLKFVVNDGGGLETGTSTTNVPTTPCILVAEFDQPGGFFNIYINGGPAESTAHTLTGVDNLGGDFMIGKSEVLGGHIDADLPYLLGYPFAMGNAQKNYNGNGLAARLGTTWTDI